VRAGAMTDSDHEPTPSGRVRFAAVIQVLGSGADPNRPVGPRSLCSRHSRPSVDRTHAFRLPSRVLDRQETSLAVRRTAPLEDIPGRATGAAQEADPACFSMRYKRT